MDLCNVRGFLEHLEQLVLEHKAKWYNGEQEHSDVANLIYFIEELGYALDTERFVREVNEIKR